MENRKIQKHPKVQSPKKTTFMKRGFMNESGSVFLLFITVWYIDNLQYGEKSVGNDGRFLPELGWIVSDPPNPQNHWVWKVSLQYKKCPKSLKIISKWWSFLPHSQQNHGSVWGRWVSVVGFHFEVLDEYPTANNHKGCSWQFSRWDVGSDVFAPTCWSSRIDSYLTLTFMNPHSISELWCFLNQHRFLDMFFPSRMFFFTLLKSGDVFRTCFHVNGLYTSDIRIFLGSCGCFCVKCGMDPRLFAKHVWHIFLFFRV